MDERGRQRKGLKTTRASRPTKLLQAFGRRLFVGCDETGLVDADDVSSSENPGELGNPDGCGRTG